MAPYAVETKGLAKKAGKHQVIKNLDLSILEKECLVFLGTKKSGKTTLINVLCGKIPPDQGTLYIHGKKYTAQSSSGMPGIELIAQEDLPDQNKTLEELLNTKAALLKFSDPHKKSVLKEVLDLLELKNEITEPINKLSPEKQVYAKMALALMTQPEILFIDQPAQGLSSDEQLKLWRFLTKIKGHQTLILTTANWEEAFNLADRIALLSQGKLLALGTPAEIKRDLFSIETFEVKTTYIPENVLKAMVNRFSKVMETTEGVEIMGDELNTEEIEEFFQEHDVTVKEINIKQPSLEALFKRLRLKDGY